MYRPVYRTRARPTGLWSSGHGHPGAKPGYGGASCRAGGLLKAETTASAKPRDWGLLPTAHDIGVTFLKPPFTASLQNIPHPGHPRSCSGGSRMWGALSSSPQLFAGTEESSEGSRGEGRPEPRQGQRTCSLPELKTHCLGKRGRGRTCLCIEGGRRITPGEGSVWWAGERGRSILCCLLAYTIETHSCKNVFLHLGLVELKDTINSEIQIKGWV